MEDICKTLLQQTGQDICKLLEEAGVCEALLIGGGGAAAALLTPALLAALGFTSGGIAAGSIGAKMMSLFAMANGGGIAAGGIVATLQSIGAAGLSWFSTGAAASTGGTVGWLLSAICNQTKTQ